MFRLTNNDQFIEWRNTIESRLEQLNGLVSWELDYSIDSIDNLETWLLREYTELKLALTADEYPIIDACGTYVGEVLRRNLDGEWVIELNDQEYAYLGIPGISGFRGYAGVPVYPHTWVTTSIDRRTGNFLRTRLEKLIT